MADGAEVVVRPSGITVRVRPGETLAEAAWRQGYRWPTVCWGQAECMACAARLISGEAATLPADAQEEAAMRARMSPSQRGPEVRLACRLRITADGVVVEKKGVLPPPDPPAG